MVKVIESEADANVRESLFFAMSSLIKADHFEGKQRFISDFDGLGLLTRLLSQDATVRFRRK